MGKALRAYEKANNLYEKSNEYLNSGAVSHLIANCYEEMGLSQFAWKNRWLALQNLVNYPETKPYHNILWETAIYAEKWPTISILLCHEDVYISKKYLSPLVYLEALLQRAKCWIRNNQPKKAREDLNYIERNLEQINNLSQREKFQESWQWSTIKLKLINSKEKTLNTLTEILNYKERFNYHLGLFEVYLERAKYWSKAGNLEKSESDLSGCN